jgi:hypothetical protein
MTTCNICSSAISDPAEEWPDDNGGIIRQECWERECSLSWWAMVRALARRGCSMPDHLIIDLGRQPSQIRCLHCGFAQDLQLPMAIHELAALERRINAEHRTCRPRRGSNPPPPGRKPAPPAGPPPGREVQP